MITIHLWKAQGSVLQLIPPEEFSAVAIAEEDRVWIDLVGEESDLHREFLQDRLGIPKLAVDDAMRDRHPPKFEDLERNWHFLLMRGFDARNPNIKFGTIQLALFWRRGVLVTRHAKPSASVEELRTMIAEGEAGAPEDAWSLLYTLLRKLLDRYLPITLRIEARLEEIEELLLKQPSDKWLRELMEFSSQLKRLRRISGYHERSLASMRTHPAALEGVEVARLTDLHEQAERLSSLSSLLYEITTDLIDGYLSVSAHRLNNVMRVLTVVTVLFVPLTFIAGIYGMNFEYIPELAWHGGYFVVLGVMTTIAIGLLLLFRQRKWI